MLVAGGSAGQYAKFLVSKWVSEIFKVFNKKITQGSPVESPEMLAPCNQQDWKSTTAGRTPFQPLWDSRI